MSDVTNAFSVIQKLSYVKNCHMLVYSFYGLLCSFYLVCYNAIVHLTTTQLITIQRLFKFYCYILQLVYLLNNEQTCKHNQS